MQHLQSLSPISCPAIVCMATIPVQSPITCCLLKQDPPHSLALACGTVLWHPSCSQSDPDSGATTSWHYSAETSQGFLPNQGRMDTAHQAHKVPPDLVPCPCHQPSFPFIHLPAAAAQACLPCQGQFLPQGLGRVLRVSLCPLKNPILKGFTPTTSHHNHKHKDGMFHKWNPVKFN